MAIADDGRRQELHARAEALQALRLGDGLVRLARCFYEHAVEALRERGYPEVKLSFTTLLPHLDRRDGTRLTELAARMEVSKQAVGQMVTELEALGYVERTPDPADGRAKLVRLTAAGFEVLLAGLEVYAELETALAQRLGVEEVAQFSATAREALEILRSSP